ncbi:(deoxy)nucleoside triphosphate pyrophosphohydrolase [Natroniella acetigena]|uniref:(deoxy)nucleoside triphosphate pyrophosphohydrolase n=1 Tax=Natroniella acetigena TaxID=52004 RepID=UPI00200B52E0|nr:(deoxy)nucleoside triphosphate pyrophosphohydrolase [Natroniella acetigena]MCK8826598.1 (deoxy)nucleoside triphosphate pyrophosphohydrolase [Natroniella acetigena]
MLDVTAAVIINKNQEVFIAQRNKPQELAGKWEFSGGKIEENEVPKEGLNREIKEEFGVVIRIDRFMVESVYQYDFGKVRILAYLAEIDSGEIEVREHNDAKWVSVGELDNCDFVPADLKIVNKIKEELN